MLIYLVNTQTNLVREANISLAEARELVKLGKYRFATPPERIDFVKNKKPQFELTFKPAEGELNIYFSAPQFRYDGYSTVADFMVKYLRKQGIFLNRQYTGQQIGLVYNHPRHLRELQTPYKILYTGFESTKMPKEWEEDLKLADEVWVFSDFCKKAMKDTFGINAKVFPHGFDAVKYPYIHRLPDEKYRFLHYDAFKWRKGYDLVLNAFEKAFPTEDDVELIMKTSREKALPIDYRNTRVLKGAYSADEMRDLMEKCHCFVFPSRGEGYGMTPLEALSTGMDVIVTDKGGMTEYNHESCVFTVDSDPIPAVYENYKEEDLGEMYEARIDELAEKMRIVKKLAEETKQYSHKSNHEVAQRYNAQVLLKPMAERIKKIAKTISPTMKGKFPQLSLIVLTYNAWEYTEKCLKSIAENTFCDYELIVIDNNSNDGSKTKLQNALQTIFKDKDMSYTLILNEENKGVAGGRNQGIKIAKGHYICFLDNDVEVGEFWHKHLTDILDTNGDVWVVGKGGTNVASFNPVTWDSPSRAIQDVDVVAGFCFMFPRKIIPLIGEQYEGLGKFWHEDLEFCARVRKYGKKIIRNTEIPIVHHEHKSMSKDTPNGTKQFSGFFEKGKEVGKRLLDSNVVVVHRMPDCETYSSYDVIANNVVPALREAGFVVLRKPVIYTENKSFDLCKGFEMEFNGNRMMLAHCENDRPPRSWLKEFELIDVIWCVSPHVYNALLTAGVPKEKLINFACSGFDAETYNFDVEPFDYLPFGKPDHFTFFTVGASQPRKGTDILIKAFAEEFEHDEKVQLVVKNYNYGQRFWVEDLISQAEHPNISTIYDTWDDKFLAQVYKTVSRNGAFVVTHRGEGFGMPQCEAVACGCRLGTTSFGGCATNFRSESDPLLNCDLKDQVELFDYTLMPSTFHNNPAERYYEKDETPLWAEPDVPAVRKWLRSVFNEQYNASKAKVVSDYIRSTYGFENRAQEFAKRLRYIGTTQQITDFE